MKLRNLFNIQRHQKYFIELNLKGGTWKTVHLTVLGKVMLMIKFKNKNFLNFFGITIVFQLKKYISYMSKTLTVRKKCRYRWYTPANDQTLQPSVSDASILIIRCCSENRPMDLEWGSSYSIKKARKTKSFWCWPITISS